MPALLCEPVSIAFPEFPSLPCLFRVAPEMGPLFFLAAAGTHSSACDFCCKRLLAKIPWAITGKAAGPRVELYRRRGEAESRQPSAFPHPTSVQLTPFDIGEYHHGLPQIVS